MILKNLFVAVTTLFLTSHKNIEEKKVVKNADDQSTVFLKQNQLIGKTGIITFTHFQVEETFVSESILHWTIRNQDGSVTEGDENISFKKLNDNQFFINWIEKTGLTVSQIIDIKNHIVTSFISRNDEKSSQGGRSANFLEGKFEFKK